MMTGEETFAACEEILNIPTIKKTTPNHPRRINKLKKEIDRSK